MKLKINNLFKKYKLAIYIALDIIIIGTIGVVIGYFIINDSSLKEFKNDYYSFKYDSSWRISKKEDNQVKLKHNKESTIRISLVALKDEYRYLTIKEILDELLYNIENQNKEYKLISKKEDTITKNNYDGYKMLYENGNNQSMVVVSKKSDKLIVFIYEASSDYFDILLDSVCNIIYNFDIKEQSFNLSHNIKIEKTKIKYDESLKVKKLLAKTKQDEIADKNYHVKYSIPANFDRSRVDSTSSYFNFKDLKDGSINLSAYIVNKSIYRHLDKKEYGNVYQNWESYKTNKDYSKFTEALDELDSDYESYIYKNSYYDKTMTYDKDFNMTYIDRLNENVVLMYALDKSHLLLINISSSKVGIPKELIDMIKIDSSENYSSYIASSKKDGYIYSELIKESITTDEVKKITLKLPDKYKEIDKEQNVYTRRYYNLGYNESLDIYNYEVSYSLEESSKIASAVKSINDSFPKAYGNYKHLKYVGDKKINKKKFKVYDGGYTELSGIMFTNINRKKYYVNVKVLFYELSTGDFLTIKVEGNGVSISDALLNELTNF